MNKKLLKKLESIFKTHLAVKLVYLFGSRVKGKTGPLSDYDFALYLEEKNKKRCLNYDFS